MSAPLAGQAVAATRGSRARPGGRRAGRRAGRGRRSPGRRPSRPAPADPVDRGSRAPAPRLADVRRRHPRAAARAASACDRRRAPALAAPSRRGRSRAAPGAAGAVRRADRTVRTLTRASAAELLPASGLSGVWITAILPVALALMSLEVIRELWREGLTPWRARTSVAWALGTTGVIVGSVLLPLLAGVSPLLVLVIGFLVTGALGLPLALPGADRPHLPDRHRRRRPRHPADQDPRRRRLVRAAGNPAVHPRRRADGDRRHLRAHRQSGDGDRGQGPRRPGDGRGRRRDPVLRHLGIDGGGGRVRDQRAAGALDAGAPATRARNRSASSPRRRRWASWRRRA